MASEEDQVYQTSNESLLTYETSAYTNQPINGVTACDTVQDDNHMVLDIRTNAMEVSGAESMSLEGYQVHPISSDMVFKPENSDNFNEDFVVYKPINIIPDHIKTPTCLDIRTDSMETSEPQSMAPMAHQYPTSYGMFIQSKKRDSSNQEINVYEPFCNIPDHTVELPAPERKASRAEQTNSFSESAYDTSVMSESFDDMQVNGHPFTSPDIKPGSITQKMPSDEGQVHPSESAIFLQSKKGSTMLEQVSYNASFTIGNSNTSTSPDIKSESGELIETSQEGNNNPLNQEVNDNVPCDIMQERRYSVIGLDVKSEGAELTEKRVQVLPATEGTIVKCEEYSGANAKACSLAVEQLINPTESNVCNGSTLHRNGCNCKECGKRFAPVNNLQKHPVKAVNKGGRFLCQQCGIIFSKGHALSAHLGVHLNGYNCKECGKGFRKERGLKIHIAKDHANSESFVCKWCDKLFTDEVLLTSHLEIHEERYHCKECGKVYQHMKNLKVHMLKAHGNYAPLSCKQCRKTFPNETSFAAHLDVHKKGYNCSKCGRGYEYENGLRTHIRRAHTDFNKEYNCKECDTVYDYKKDLKAHMLQAHHVNKKGYYCKECNRAFEYKTDLKQHAIQAHSILKKGYHCKKCDREFEYKKDLKEHMVQIHFLGYKCNKCYKSFVYKKDLTEHILITHNVHKEVYNCNLCEGVYDSKQGLNKHMVKIHNVRNRIYKCQKCDKSYDKTKYLRKHLLLRHRARKTQHFCCYHCPKVYTSRGGLKSHLRGSHNVFNLRRYDCKECDEFFNYKQDLNKHVRLSHSVLQKVYSCMDCDKSFPCGVDLTNHLLTEHVNFAPSSCKQCRKVLPHETALSVHLDAHQRRYNCCKCDKGFQYEKYLMVHLAEAHKTVKNIHACELCGIRSDSQQNLIKHQMEAHDGNGPLSCRLCRKLLPNDIFLADHLEKHKNLFNCEKCGKCFKDKKTLQVHMLLHDPDRKKYNCKTCDEGFNERHNLSMHTLMAHSFSCKKCGKMFRRKKWFSDHLHLHKIGHNCDQCGKVFSREVFLANHILERHNDKNVFNCNHCGKVCFTKESLSHHLNQHKKQLPCDKCGKSFTTMKKLHHHILEVHGVPKMYSCEHCHRKFNFEPMYLEHLELHKTGYTCCKCPKVYRSEAAVHRHMEIFHRMELRSDRILK